MIGVVVNPRSGYVARHGVAALCSEITAALPDSEIKVLMATASVAGLCADLLAHGAACIAVAGGDGTVSSVAGHLAGGEIPLGVIPAGTFNHFARDVGVGRDVATALRTLSHGRAVSVDVASVNGRVFLNNSSIGAYASMVHVRERYERRLGKWRALLWAAWLVARRAHSIDLEIVEANQRERLSTYLLFIGNNEYQLRPGHLGQRAALDGGHLACFALERTVRLRLLPSVFHLLRDARMHRKVFRAFSTTEMTVTLSTRRHGRIAVACDGEVLELVLPLVYCSLPRTLKVIVPESVALARSHALQTP